MTNKWPKPGLKNTQYMLISYHKEHFALSGHPLLYSSVVSCAYMDYSDTLGTRSRARDMVARLRPKAAGFLRRDVSTRHGNAQIVSARFHKGNSPHPNPSPSTLPTAGLIMGPTHLHFHLHKRWRPAEGRRF